MSLSVIVALALSIATASAPVPSADSLLSPADLRADLALLREAYVTMHPGLHRYSTSAEVAARFDAVDAYFATPRSAREAFLALTRLTASIKCGHSYPNFWNQSRAVKDALFSGHDRLPFEFRWLDGRMIVTADHSREQRVPRGTEIVTINGIAARAVLTSLMPLARADGNNDAKRVAYLEVQGRSEWFAFDVLYPMVFPTRDTLYTLTTRAPRGASQSRRSRPQFGVQTVSLRALTLAERRSQGDAPESTTPDSPLWSYDETDGIGMLHMPTWSLYNSKWNATQWLDSLLIDLAARNVPNLVIDLRGNEGGDDVGSWLLARFIGEPLTLPRYRKVVTYRSAPTALRHALDTWDPSFLDWGTAAQGPDSSGTYGLVRSSGDTAESTIIRPEGTRYRGRVWVIVGASNSSATFQFANAIKRTGLATLVGQPTGGNRRGINGGAFMFVRLARIGLEVDLPLIGEFPFTEEADAGVEPDVLVRPTIGQITADIDAEMAEVERRIRGTRPPSSLP